MEPAVGGRGGFFGYHRGVWSRVFMWMALLVFVFAGCGVVTSVLSKEEVRESEFAEVTVARVVDGDTVEVFPAVSSTESVRLIGMDAPEEFGDSGAEPYAREATAFAEESLAGEAVRLEFDEELIDDYGRALAYVHHDGEMFNERLVEEGLAQVATFPPNTRHLELFEAAQERAREAERGIWSLPESESCLLRDRRNGVGGGC
ncbi:MAG: thermonuclease family protein [Actinomycetota bacterium]|nr:thermonuclease family protein [Actinomycetota bacterium]